MTSIRKLVMIIIIIIITELITTTITITITIMVASVLHKFFIVTSNKKLPAGKK